MPGMRRWDRVSSRSPGIPASLGSASVKHVGIGTDIRVWLHQRLGFKILPELISVFKRSINNDS